MVRCEQMGICEWGKRARSFDTRLTQRSLHFDTSLIRVSKHVKFDMFDMCDSNIKTYQRISKTPLQAVFIIFYQKKKGNKYCPSKGNLNEIH